MGIADSPADLQRYRLTVEQYHRMGDAGVFAPDARVELIEGEVIEMAPMRSRHASVVARLLALLQPAVDGRALVWCQLPLLLGDSSEPEPDLMLLRPRTDFYASAHPVPADVLLLIEVADTSIRYDLGVKVPLYARDGVAEVWVVDLNDNVLRIYRGPQGNEYTAISASATPGMTPVALLPDTSIDLTGILA